MQKFRKTEYIEIDHHDFEELVEKTFGQRYDFPDDHESSNDTYHKFIVKKKPLDSYDQADFEEFVKTGKSKYIANVLFTVLANDEKIEEGYYLVSVSW